MAESTPQPERECRSISDCSVIANSVCDFGRNVCSCEGDLPVFVPSPPGCYRPAPLNATCQYEAQCVTAEEYSTCDLIKKICVCISGYEMKEYPDIGVNCVTKSGKSSGSQVDPAMIGVLAGLALMFIIICVVLRLFSKARFRETRSIFNTPNPRLMNASLFKDRRRGSVLSTVSATGSAGGVAPPSVKTPSPIREDKKPRETTVGIEAVD